MLTAIKTIVKPLGDVHGLKPYSPDVALTDFEIAIQNAFLACFPFISIKGCYFHFKHAHQGWISKHTLKKIFQSNYAFRIWVKHYNFISILNF